MSMIPEFLVAMVATICFSVTFQVSRRHYLDCGLTGAVGWVAYRICVSMLGLSAPIATLIAALPLTVAARLFSIQNKAPVTVYLLCGIFPLVPGAGIYYTAYYFLQNQQALCVEKGIETIKIAVALALGIALVGSLPVPKRWRNR